MKVVFYINGQQVNEPNNYEELSIDLNFNDDSISEAVTVNDWEIGVGDSSKSNDGYSIIDNIISKGITGGVGVTEGIPFTIELDDEISNTDKLFDGYLDSWSAKYDPTNKKIIAPAVEQGKLDWLNNVVDSVSFEYLASTGKITRDNYVAVPYVINKKQNTGEALLTLVSIYMMGRQLKQAIDYLIDTINDYDIIYISTIIRVIAQILQIILLIAAMVKLIVDLYKMLIQPVKYHYGMYLVDSLRIGLQELGMGFKSSFLEDGEFKDILIMPEKYNLKEDNTGIFSDIVGFVGINQNDRRGFYKGTLGQLLRLIKATFRAKIVIDSNNTVYLEKQDFNLRAAQYQLPDYEPTGYRLNVDDFYSNKILTFQIDTNDRNTIQEYTGTSIQIIQEPKVVNNERMKLTRNFTEINTGFALGRRKTSLTFMEKRLETITNLMTFYLQSFMHTVNGFYNIVDESVKTVNKIIKALKVVGVTIKPIKVPKMINNIRGLLENIEARFDGTRLGMLKMESDFITVPKMLLVPYAKTDRKRLLNADSDSILSAENIYNNFHYFDSFVPNVDGIHGQYLIEEIPEIPFPNGDYQLVKNKNEILNAEGLKAKLVNLKINPVKQTATGTVKVNKIYTTNIKETKIIPDGK